jgi:hypothetical protein
MEDGCRFKESNFLTPATVDELPLFGEMEPWNVLRRMWTPWAEGVPLAEVLGSAD